MIVDKQNEDLKVTELGPMKFESSPYVADEIQIRKTQMNYSSKIVRDNRNTLQ